MPRVAKQKSPNVTKTDSTANLGFEATAVRVSGFIPCSTIWRSLREAKDIRWLAAKGENAFTTDQLQWLHSIRDYIATRLSIKLDDLDYTPFNQEGGLGKIRQLFGGQLPSLVEELNESLAA